MTTTPIATQDGSADLGAFRGDVLSADPFGLLGTRCRNGHTTFPSRSFCPVCRCDDVAEHRLLGTGAVHSYTVVRQAPAGMEVPYVLAYVDLDEGCRLMGRLTGPGALDVEIGSQITVIPDVFDSPAGRSLGFAFQITSPESGEDTR